MNFLLSHSPFWEISHAIIANDNMKTAEEAGPRAILGRHNYWRKDDAVASGA